VFPEWPFGESESAIATFSLSGEDERMEEDREEGCDMVYTLFRLRRGEV
jgi:hypothetical protein